VLKNNASVKPKAIPNLASRVAKNANGLTLEVGWLQNHDGYSRAQAFHLNFVYS
jgi:hypothetical protein